MCLAIPAKVVEINWPNARVEVGGNAHEANLSLLEGVQVGDYVMVHAGFAIARYEPEEAQRTLDVLREMLGEPL